MNGKSVEIGIAEVAWRCFGDKLPPRDSAPEATKEWFSQLLAVFAPAESHLDQVPATTAFLFGFDPEAARSEADNAAVLSADSARTVLGEFASRVRAHAGPVRPEDFKAWLDEIEGASGVKDDELLQPVRIALTGAHSGPEIAELLTLIEDGAALGLAIPSVAERVEQFVGV
jgi:nondiscriminating glutamyl-tRNA synthetase